MPSDDEQTNGATGAEGALTSEQRAEAGRVADLQRERARRQELEGKLAALEAAQADAARKAAEEAGKHRELYEGLKPKHDEIAAKLAAYEARESARVAAVTERNAARIAALPEPFRALVPEGLDPDAASVQVERLEGIARQQSQTFAAGSQAGAGAGAGKKPTPPPECVDLARKLGKTTPEAIEAFYPVWLQTSAGKAHTAKAGAK